MDIGRISAARALSANKATAKIGVCIPREIHFFYDQLWSGVLEEAERVSQSGVEFINRPIQNLGEGDVEAFQELMSAGVDGIILTAGNPRNLRPLIDEAERTVFAWFAWIRMLQRVAVPALFAWNLFERMRGRRVAGQDCSAGSKVAVVAGMLMAEDHRRKPKGFRRLSRNTASAAKLQPLSKVTKTKRRASRRLSICCGAFLISREFMSIPLIVCLSAALSRQGTSKEK